MYSTWQTWRTTKLADFPDGTELEMDVIQPAIKAIEDFAIGSYLAWCSSLLTPNPSDIKNEPIPEGWDSTVRYNTCGRCKAGLLLEPVLPYQDNPSDSIRNTINPDHSLPGVIAFAHSNPLGGFTSKVKQWEDDGRIHIEVTVTIPNESLFQTGWFRLQ